MKQSEIEEKQAKQNQATAGADEGDEDEEGPEEGGAKKKKRRRKLND